MNWIFQILIQKIVKKLKGKVFVQTVRNLIPAPAKQYTRVRVPADAAQRVLLEKCKFNFL